MINAKANTVDKTVILELLRETLSQKPEITARELVRRINAEGYSLTKKEINPVLYKHSPKIFQNENPTAGAPHWSLSPEADPHSGTDDFPPDVITINDQTRNSTPVEKSARNDDVNDDFATQLFKELLS